MIIAAVFSGPVGSPYPGTPIAVAFLVMMVAVGIKTARLRRTRRYNTPGLLDRGADIVVVIAAMLFIAGVLWTGLTHR